jgi:two-component system, NarL family, nitrate/nitrite response regulator NarL
MSVASEVTSVFIVTSTVLLREGLTSFLQNTPYEVTACAAGPAELPHICHSKERRALAIVGMTRRDGNLDQTAEIIRQLRSSIPQVKVVLVAETHGSTELRGVLALSPDAYIFNLASRDTLIKVLELTLMHERVFVLGGSAALTTSDSTGAIGNEAQGNLARDPLPSGFHQIGVNGQSPLSQREHQVLACLALGQSNKAIARQYNMSEGTVKVHLKAILRKLKAQNRTQAAVWAIENGFRDSFVEHNEPIVTDAPKSSLQTRRGT